MNEYEKDINLVKERVKICNNCDMLQGLLKMCKVCKCFVAFKASIKTEKCPIGKW